MKLLILLLFAGCMGGYPNACHQYATLYFDTCPVEDEDEAYATCLETGELTPSDFPAEADISAEDAKEICIEFLAQVNYPSPDASAYCKQNLEILQKYEEDACDLL